jgi:hypothetical protein
MDWSIGFDRTKEQDLNAPRYSGLVFIYRRAQDAEEGDDPDHCEPLIGGNRFGIEPTFADHLEHDGVSTI